MPIAQSASLYPTRVKPSTHLLQHKPKSIVHFRYLITCLTATHLNFDGFDKYCDSLVMIQHMSGLVQIMAYIRQPTTSRYVLGSMGSSSFQLLVLKKWNVVYSQTFQISQVLCIDTPFGWHNRHPVQNQCPRNVKVYKVFHFKSFFQHIFLVSHNSE